MIRFANRDDIDSIMHFIDTYWKKGHILGNNRNFFEYEHLLPDGTVTYVISEQDDEINAILGYIPYGMCHRDVMTVMWKANHTADPSLGLSLFQYLKERGDVRMMASPGSNKKLKGLYNYLGYSFGKMNQWYRLRPDISYTVAKIFDAHIPKLRVPSAGGFLTLETWDALQEAFDFQAYASQMPKPHKEPWYICKRYFQHPVYHYEAFGVRGENGKAALLLFFRLDNVSGRNVIHLIDCIGDYSRLPEAGSLLDELLERHDAEYIDIYESGLPEEYLLNGGWTRRDKTENIIPNYFSPFVRENIEIYYFSSDADAVLFKGDGDQDRPS